MPYPRAGQTVLLSTIVGDGTTGAVTLTDIDRNPITLAAGQRLWIDYIYVALPTAVS